MITIKLNTHGEEKSIALTRFFNENDVQNALAYVNTKPDTVVVCLDTPATTNFLKFVEELVRNGRKVIVRDHHDVNGQARSLREEEVRDSAQMIRSLLDKKTIISNREKNPGCSSLVTEAEFSGDSFTIVCDADADGLTAGMKAIGVTYPELDVDAAILDGPPTKKTRENGLSQIGETLVKGIATLPPFNDPNYENSSKELYEIWVQATQGDIKSLELLKEKVQVFEEMVNTSKELAGTATNIREGLCFVDLTSAQHKVHLGTLEQELEKTGCKIIVLKTNDGPIAKLHGVQYSLSRLSGDKSLDMLSFFPESFVSSPESGYIGNVQFRVHCSEENWENYVLPKITLYLDNEASKEASKQNTNHEVNK